MAVDIEKWLMNQYRSNLHWKLVMSCYPPMTKQHGSVAERSKALV